MMSLDVVLDEASAKFLQEMSARLGIDPAVMASRLVERAIRAARPRPVYDAEALKAYAAENATEEGALADSDSAHRQWLLLREDKA